MTHTPGSPTTDGASPGVSISLPSPLFPARFVHRPNRFVVHALLDGELLEGGVAGHGRRFPDGASHGDRVVCHLADPGRLEELLLPSRRLLLRYAPSPTRKTDWSVVLVEAPGGDGWVSVDTTLPNRLIERALREDALEEFAGWKFERTEFTHGRSRLDFLLSDGLDRFMAVEVKSVTLVDDGEALFPDAITARGARHVRELADLASRSSWEAVVLFVLQRDDAGSIRAARYIDPDFADALAEAREAGVRIHGRRCRVAIDAIELGGRVPVR